MIRYRLYKTVQNNSHLYNILASVSLLLHSILKISTTVRTLVWFFSSVTSHVLPNIVNVSVFVFAVFTLDGFHVMPFHVLSQVTFMVK